MNLNNDTLLLTNGWINGAEVVSDTNFAVINPATGNVVANVSDLTGVDVASAISAADVAFQEWKTVPSQERAAAVNQWASLIEDNAADLGSIVCRENGKPIGEATGEVLQCAALLRWYAQEALRLHGSTLPVHDNQQRNMTIKQPIGVVACITPWNFPAAAVIVKAGAAIAAGCTTIIKPSDETPLIALAFARLSTEAGIPKGVFNVIPCKDPREVGDALCQSNCVRMLSFTGSTAVGKQLYTACGNTMKRMALELGGNAPFVVFADADLERAVGAAVGARFYNSGQICVGANRFFIHEDIYAEFAERLTERVSRLKVGNGEDTDTNTGPMINSAAITRLRQLVSEAVGRGAEILVGGGQTDGDSLFFRPTVLANMTPQMDAYKTEIFGPIACLYDFETETEALELANDTNAGLSAYVFTGDLSRLLRFSEGLEAGVVGANSANIFSNDLPFGGSKESGLGKEHGINCLEEFVETKSICIGL